MSLKSVLALIDDKLEEAFYRKAPSADKARNRALKTIETAKRQFASTEPTRGRKAFAIGGNDVVSFTPGYSIDGRSTVFVPASRFDDFLDNLAKAIQAGELDDALTAENDDGDGSSEKKPTNTGKRGPLSEESLARRRAKVKARKAAEANA